MEKLHIGFIGNGKSANRYHIPYILTRPESLELKTIYRRNPAHDAWPTVPGVHYTDSLDELLQDPQIDLVVISTRHDTHASFARKVLEAGKHCLVEKPFSLDAKEAKELFALAKEKNLVLQAYQNRRYDSDFLTLKKVLDSGNLGTLLEVESHFDYYRPEVPASAGSYSRENSFLYGHACHSLDQMISLFGVPDVMKSDVRSLLGPGRMNDYFDLDLYYKAPLKVSIGSSYHRLKSRPKFTAYGTKGVFVKASEDRQEEDLKKFYMPGQPGFGLDRQQDYGLLTWIDDEGKWHEEKVISETGDYALYYDALYKAIRQGESLPVPPEETIALTELLEQAAESLEQTLPAKEASH